MKEYLTKRNLIIAGVAVVLLAVIIITVIMQLGSEIPVITFECGTLDQKETGIFYEPIAVDWRGGTKEARELGKAVNEVGYYQVMQGQASCVMYTGRMVNFSFEEVPEHVTLYVYDNDGNILQSGSLDENYSFELPSTMESQLYVIEGVWEKGTCAYAFWVMTL